MRQQTLIRGITLLVIFLNLSCARSVQVQQETATSNKPPVQFIAEPSMPGEEKLMQSTTPEQFTAANYTVTGPYSHRNLTIFLLHGKDERQAKPPLTLKEAMDQEKVIVHETGNVNSLAIENISDEEVYVQSGDIVKGGQQDRVLATDLIVPPKSGKIPIESFCVEQSRWSGRGQESAGRFSSSDNMLNSKELKIAAKHGASQQEVWNKVAATQSKLGAGVAAAGVAGAPSSANAQFARRSNADYVPVTSDQSASSLQLTLENKRVRDTSTDYIKKLSSIVDGKNDVTGYAFAINGQMNSADIYSSHQLFKKLWPKLLESSAIEAIGELVKDGQYQPVTAGAVKAFLGDAGSGSANEKEVTPHVLAVKRESEKNLFFETRDRKQKGVWVHRNYIAK